MERGNEIEATCRTKGSFFWCQRLYRDRNRKRKIKHILEGKGDGTYIGSPFQEQMQMRKQWIAYHSKVSGTIEIDEGAENALLHKGKSLLPAGVINVFGSFQALDVVNIVNQKGEVIARGQVYYAADDLAKVKGLASEEAKRYSFHRRPEVVHRDNLVCFKKQQSNKHEKERKK